MNDIILSPLPLRDLENLVFTQVCRALSQLNPQTPDPVREDLLTIAQAAELLSVAVPTVYGYVHQRAIPCMKRRGRLYFSRTELLEWIKTSRRSTIDEIRSEAIQSIPSMAPRRKCKM